MNSLTEEGKGDAEERNEEGRGDNEERRGGELEPEVGQHIPGQPCVSVCTL